MGRFLRLVCIYLFFVGHFVGSARVSRFLFPPVGHMFFIFFRWSASIVRTTVKLSGGHDSLMGYHCALFMAGITEANYCGTGLTGSYNLGK